MATLRATQKALTRQLLMNAGLELFQTRGYGSTTIDEIATRAGTTRVTFYAHFASRSALMKALINEKLNEEVHRTRSADRSTAPELVEVVREGSESKMADWIRTTSARWPTVQPILRVARDAAVVDPELSTLVDTWLEEAISDVAEGLEQAGRFDPGGRRYRASLAVALFDYTALHWPTPAWTLDREAMVQTLAQSWAKLLGPE
jgi:AcrR family transcriptional regulator